MNPVANYYEFLELSDRTATQQEIKKQYRKLVKKYHPDNENDIPTEVKEERIRQVNIAYQCLSDPDMRLTYDFTLRQYEEWLKEEERKNAYSSYTSSYSNAGKDNGDEEEEEDTEEDYDGHNDDTSSTESGAYAGFGNYGGADDPFMRWRGRYTACSGGPVCSPLNFHFNPSIIFITIMMLVGGYFLTRIFPFILIPIVTVLFFGNFGFTFAATAFYESFRPEYGHTLLFIAPSVLLYGYMVFKRFANWDYIGIVKQIGTILSFSTFLFILFPATADFCNDFGIRYLALLGFPV